MGELYSVTIPKELRDLLSEKVAVDLMVKALNLAAFDVRDHLRKITPKYTGETAAAWRVSKYAKAGDLSIGVGNDKDTMVMIEYGTGIYATQPIEGVTVDDLQEEYPSMRPRFIIRGSTLKFEEFLTARVTQALQEAFGG